MAAGEGYQSVESGEEEGRVGRVEELEERCCQDGNETFAERVMKG